MSQFRRLANRFGAAPLPGEKLSGGDPSSRPGGKLVEDNIPEDQSLVVDTDRGLVVLTGCGHAGLINILTYAHQTVRPGARVYAAWRGTFSLLTRTRSGGPRTS
jgi:metal-dependent hydrolase (beta-lactamase superfamily II)